MKTTNLITVALVSLAIGFTSCSKDEVEAPFYTAPTSTSHELNSYEQAGLLALVEQEKMHRDVYVWMNSQFPNDVFASLAERDQHYMDLLSVRIDKYDLINPVADKLPGEFANAAIQDQYNEIVSSTEGDLEAMLIQAKAMEAELIVIVQEQQSTISGNADIVQLYSDLIEESQGQLNVLTNETEGLIHIYAPKPPVAEM